MRAAGLHERGVALLAPRSSVLGHDPCGGSEVVLWEDVAILQSAGIPVRVYGRAALPGAPVTILPLRTKGALITSLEYCGAFVRREPAAVLLAYNEPTVAGLAPERAIVRFDWTTPLPRYWNWPGLRERFGRARYVFPSQDQRRELLGAHAGLRGGRAVVIPNAVDLDRFRPPDRRSERAGPVVGFAGQWSPEKGLAVLLDAWMRLGDDAAELRLAGGFGMWKRDSEAPGAGELDHLLAAAQVADRRIRRIGELPRTAMPAFWGDVDVAVVPSLRESFGLQALEALACGVPVVASRAGGLAEIVEHDRCGLLVPPDDPAALADALREVLTDEGLRRRLATGARKRAEEFSLAARSDRLLDLVEQVAESSPRRRDAASPRRATGPSPDRVTAFVALLGRRDAPTDALEDYSRLLGSALERQGASFELARVPWHERGAVRALRGLWTRADAWQGRWILVQHSMLQWSRRGFPVLLLGVLAVLKARGARPIVVFHDPSTVTVRRGVGPLRRAADRLRRLTERFVNRTACRLCERVVVTLPPPEIEWLRDPARALFLPVGPNIPSRDEQPLAPSVRTGPRVAVFSLPPGAALEESLETTARAVAAAATLVPGIELFVVGRGSAEAGELLRARLEPGGVRVSAAGIIPDEQVSTMLQSCDAQLVPRGGISSRRGSAIAGLACGLPVVAYAGAETGPPISEAGVLLAAEGDADGLGAALAQVLSDEPLRRRLGAASLAVYRRWFAWDGIAKRLVEELQTLDVTEDP